MSNTQKPTAGAMNNLGAYLKIGDAADVINKVRVACLSDVYTSVTFSAEVAAKLVEAHQALLAAHRLMELELQAKKK